jgi:putative membrane protein
MTALLNRLLSAGTLMVFGSVICAMYFSGRIQQYLIPTFQSLTIVCGVVLVLLATLVLVAPDGRNASHSAARAPWQAILATLFLVIPLFVALRASKDGFGASTVLNRNYIQDASQLPSTVAPSVPDTLPTDNSSTPAVSDGENDAQPEVIKNSKGEIKAEVIDLLYAAQLPDMRSTFEDKQIEVIGQLMPAKENNPHGDRYDVMRMLMTCCAADVQPIALPVHPSAKPTLPEMTWVKISGKATFPIIGGQRHPLVENAKIEKTDPPEDTYLY